MQKIPTLRFVAAVAVGLAGIFAVVTAASGNNDFTRAAVCFALTVLLIDQK